MSKMDAAQEPASITGKFFVLCVGWYAMYLQITDILQDLMNVLYGHMPKNFSTTIFNLKTPNRVSMNGAVFLLMKS